MVEQTRQREIRDPRAMRALAHPMRLQLLELVGREGSLTATSASEHIGESVASCSFHLRQLAKYGFVEAAPGNAPREKPWRLRASGHSWTTVDDGSSQAVAARALTSVFVGRELSALEGWLERRRDEPLEWQEAASLEQSLLYLTAQQLAHVREQLAEIVARFGGQSSSTDRPAGARPVRLFAAAFPIPPTERGN